MAGRKFAEVREVPITDLTKDGKGIGKKEGRVYFVNKALPGDILNLQPYKKRKNHLYARILESFEQSPYRTEALCAHFGICGGCTIQNLIYEKQLEIKKKLIDDAFSRIAGIQIIENKNIIPADALFFYRNKLEYTFAQQGWLTDKEIESENKSHDRRALGFHIPGRYDRVLDIHKCYLQRDPSNIIRNTIKEYCLEHDLGFFDLQSNQGKLRNLIIRNSNTNENMLIIIFGSAPEKKEYALLEYIKKQFPELNSLYFIINPKLNPSIHDLECHLYSGQAYITEKLEKLSLHIGPKSFYQTHSSQALKLYQKVREWASPKKNDILYDLYCGIGSIGLFLASECQKVIGIESVPEAVKMAEKNAMLNHIEHASFFCGDAEKIINTSFIEKQGQPDILILDPPRNGLHQSLIAFILQNAPPKIIYISCNPSTQARDMILLKESYEIKKMQGFDMFPHTMHVENIALLEKKNPDHQKK
jgi:23S rRNA (uracil1939-C5)-methyltransferase